MVVITSRQTRRSLYNDNTHRRLMDAQTHTCRERLHVTWSTSTQVKDHHLAPYNCILSNAHVI